jgi:hypothetical protein
MEGLLRPNFHYVEINKDYSNLEEKYYFYLNNPRRAKTIIKNANAFMSKFKNPLIQKKIAVGVVYKYFKYSDQI